MGAPELPENLSSGDENLLPTELIQPAPNASDNESDNDNDIYDGYQPLANSEPLSLRQAQVEENFEEAVSDVESNSLAQNEVEEFPNLPIVERAEVEITRQVWNAPRSQENEIELDTIRTAQILSAMANFTLPNATIPDWAVDVPEEHWKEELLQRIRHRKEVQGTTSSQAAKENHEQQN